MQKIINTRTLLTIAIAIAFAFVLAYFVIPNVMDTGVLSFGATTVQACCDDDDGGDDDDDTPPPPPKPPVCDAFTATPNKVPYGGGDVTLKWSTSNIPFAYINKDIGKISADGQKVVHVTDTIIYKLYIPGDQGANVLCQVTITVQPTPKLPTCDAFSADPTWLPY